MQVHKLTSIIIQKGGPKIKFNLVVLMFGVLNHPAILLLLFSPKSTTQEESAMQGFLVSDTTGHG